MTWNRFEIDLIQSVEICMLNVVEMN